jgi:beta-glucanase (GH16 family)
MFLYIAILILYTPCATTTTLPPPGYTIFEALSDEFSGSSLDASKWIAKDPGWPGRQPGLFDPANVIVENGSLQLWARAAKRNDSWPAGYDNYTTSAIHSQAMIHQGYFEIRWRSGSSGISSSFWFHNNNGTAWTEIDVFETTGTDNPTKGGALAGDLPSHVHVFSLPGVNVTELPNVCNCTEGTPGSIPCSKPSMFQLPAGETFSSAFHVAGLLWTDYGVEVYLDGNLVNSIPSTCLVQEIAVDFDRETMPGWMQLPDPATLPDQPFEVDYIRSWNPPSRRL